MLNENEAAEPGAPDISAPAMTAADISPENGAGTKSFSPNWAADAPRGGKAVLNRVLKEAATVPLFLAQTFVQSLRDMGYDSTTSALCEHVDNAIGAGATSVRIYFRQIGSGRNILQNDIMVLDNGRGMAPNVLKVATSFGGSMTYGSRTGISRFGMGMKTAALSISPVLQIISWQEPGAAYRMILDTGAIGRDGKNVIELPDPEFVGEPEMEVTDFLSRPMSFPKDHTEQRLLAPAGVTAKDAMGRSGTIIYMPDCDRLSWSTAKTLVEHATKEMARIYRRKITEGLSIWINNRLIEAVDPTLAMPNARHARVEALSPKTSKLVVARRVSIRRSENVAETADAIVKLFALPIREWSGLPRKTLTEIGVFSGHTISILRNDREVFAGVIPAIAQRHSDAAWFRIEIDFPGELDEAFGVAANKQGVRLKGYVSDAIDKAIGPDITKVREQIQYVQTQNATEKKGSKPSESEARAQDADPFQAESLDVQLTDEQQAQVEENLKGLALALKRDAETDEEALARVKSSKYLITYKHDPYWPFYHVENQFGHVVLTVNTAHPFFSKLYEPLLKLSAAVDDEKGENKAKESTTALELMLLSLARAQILISRESPDAAKLFETFRRSWSDGLRVQLAD